jgi:hypothetical protein
MNPTAKKPVSPESVSTFDDMVFQASRGDRRAIGALAIAFTPSLLAEARAILAPEGRAHAAGDAVQDFLLSLAEGENVFLPCEGRAVAWMKGVVRAIARTYVPYGGGRP